MPKRGSADEASRLFTPSRSIREFKGTFCRIRREHLETGLFLSKFPLAGGRSGGTEIHKGNIDIFAFGQLFPAVGFRNKSDFYRRIPESSKEIRSSSAVMETTINLAFSPVYSVSDNPKCSLKIFSYRLSSRELYIHEQIHNFIY